MSWMLDERPIRARELFDQEKFSEAAKLLEGVVHDRERTLGKNDYGTLQSRLELSQAIQRQEMYDRSQKTTTMKKLSDDLEYGRHRERDWNTPHDPEERLREKIRGRDALLGTDDKLTLDFKLQLGQLLLERNKHQEAESIFQEVEHIRGRGLDKQSPAGSLPRAHGTTGISQEVKSPARSLPMVQSPPGSLPLVHDATAMLRDRLNTFFPAPTQNRQPYNDSEISQISRLLRQTNSAWSRVPRTYIILRTIDCLHHLDELISLDFSDYLLPVNQRSVPDCLPAKMRKLFLDSQKLILTQSLDLEKGAKGHHCHFERGDSLPFESKGILGTGGFGQVDRILSHISFEEYARKLVSRRLAFGGRGVGALKGMIGEIEALKKLEHHHIVKFVGSYTDPKFLGVIMSPVAEQDLRCYLEKAGSVNHAEMRTFFGCLATGLQFLHDHQIRHKDIKPGNILVDKGRIYLTDFGLSLDFEDATGSTTVGMVNFATRRYCAPEVALSEPRNTSSDIWSLGVIFLEMIVVLKGRTIQWMDDFLRAHGSHQKFVSSNPTGLEKLLAELKQTVNLSDNVALVWIQQILQEQHKSRPTAARLARLITQPYIQGDPDAAFCGICCLAPDDPHSDSSDDVEEENFLRGFALRARVR